VSAQKSPFSLYKN